VSRLGINLAEHRLGTNAPAVVAKTGAPVTVLGAEHYFHAMHSLHCAAAPIRDGLGQLAGVLDLTVEARPFGFDAGALVGVYATAIENRLLQAGAGEHLVLQFQVCSTMLDSPLQALVGIAANGRVAWLNSAAQQLLGHAGGPPSDAEALFGSTLVQLLARSACSDARPLRLPNGLTVWLRARLRAPDGAQHVTSLVARQPPVALVAPVTPTPPADGADGSPVPAPLAVTRTTLDQHTREVIEQALALHGGNISRAARQLGVSRGLLYRRRREWAADGAA
jgi:transcriptional regulator of acetoin/glycerol metabolism